MKDLPDEDLNGDGEITQMRKKVPLGEGRFRLHPKDPRLLVPLEDDEERRLLDKFRSVTRATLKGTAVIGILQGALAGAAFAVVGIDSAVFWGTIMVVLSVIPGIGTALVWVPAVVFLALDGQVVAAVGVGL